LEALSDNQDPQKNLKIYALVPMRARKMLNIKPTKKIRIFIYFFSDGFME
jgi:hypothetical protein